MGDRATIQIVDGPHKSPIIYLHWAGSRSLDIIRKAAPIMRQADISYAAARLIGVCHMETDPEQGLSLGVLDADDCIEAGDNGHFEIDLRTGAVRNDGQCVAHVEFGRF